MEAAVLENEALKLTAPQRALLADRLMQTLGSPDVRIVQAWAAEGERRLAAFQNGALIAEDGNAVVESFRSLRAEPERNTGNRHHGSPY
jgi:hypothetical protein